MEAERVPALIRRLEDASSSFLPGSMSTPSESPLDVLPTLTELQQCGPVQDVRNLERLVAVIRVLAHCALPSAISCKRLDIVASSLEVVVAELPLAMKSLKQSVADEVEMMVATKGTDKGTAQIICSMLQLYSQSVNTVMSILMQAECISEKMIPFGKTVCLVCQSVMETISNANSRVADVALVEGSWTTCTAAINGLIGECCAMVNKYFENIPAIDSNDSGCRARASSVLNQLATACASSGDFYSLVNVAWKHTMKFLRTYSHLLARSGGDINVVFDMCIGKVRTHLEALSASAPRSTNTHDIKVFMRSMKVTRFFLHQLSVLSQLFDPVDQIDNISGIVLSIMLLSPPAPAAATMKEDCSIEIAKWLPPAADSLVSAIMANVYMDPAKKWSFAQTFSRSEKANGFGCLVAICAVLCNLPSTVRKGSDFVESLSWILKTLDVAYEDVLSSLLIWRDAPHVGGDNQKPWYEGPPSVMNRLLESTMYMLTTNLEPEDLPVVELALIDAAIHDNPLCREFGLSMWIRIFQKMDATGQSGAVQMLVEILAGLASNPTCQDDLNVVVEVQKRLSRVVYELSPFMSVNSLRQLLGPVKMLDSKQPPETIRTGALLFICCSNCSAANAPNDVVATLYTAVEKLVVILKSLEDPSVLISVIHALISIMRSTFAPECRKRASGAVLTLMEACNKLLSTSSSNANPGLTVTVLKLLATNRMLLSADALASLTNRLKAMYSSVPGARVAIVTLSGSLSDVITEGPRKAGILSNLRTIFHTALADNDWMVRLSAMASLEVFFKFADCDIKTFFPEHMQSIIFKFISKEPSSMVTCETYIHEAGKGAMSFENRLLAWEKRISGWRGPESMRVEPRTDEALRLIREGIHALEGAFVSPDDRVALEDAMNQINTLLAR